jgi:signal transduction histidine kinase
MQDLTQPDEKEATLVVGQDLVHLVSHQLLNSAGSLQMIYHLLGDESNPLSAPHKAEALQVLQHEVHFLHRLGRYILQFDRTSSGDLLLDFNPVDMAGLIKKMLPLFQLQSANRKIDGDFETNLPLVWGDIERLQDVLNNLVSNALKYSAPMTPVTISLRQDNGQVRVSVANSGPGIPAGDEERIFARFYRGQGHQQEGYGLGLYLARRLVGQHGGRIWVESTPGKVTTFCFTLLLASQEQPLPSSDNDADLLTLSE